MHPKELNNLIEKYFLNTASEEEKRILIEWYRTQNSEIPESFQFPDSEDEVRSRILNNIKDNVQDYHADEQKVYPFWKLTGIAASLLLLISTSLYLLKTEDKVQKPAEMAAAPNDILPGGNKAILTLSNGSKIILDDVEKGVLANEAGVLIEKTSEGKITYSFSNNNTATELLYNTIETPVGGQYQVNLPDGSSVWLNSSSSLRFPAVFTGNTRDVELQGEGYFEIAKNKAKPFLVKSGNQLIQVLGTHFNVNAYTDEPTINTTLLEGSIHISELNSKKSVLLKPGEQSIVDKNIHVVKVDTLAAIAWKEGYFQFQDADIKTVMRQLGRWYGVNFKNTGAIPDQKYAGAIDKNLTLQQVLEILDKSQIRFKLEGKEVIVTPE